MHQLGRSQSDLLARNDLWSRIGSLSLSVLLHFVRHLYILLTWKPIQGRRSWEHLDFVSTKLTLSPIFTAHQIIRAQIHLIKQNRQIKAYFRFCALSQRKRKVLTAPQDDDKAWRWVCFLFTNSCSFFNSKLLHILERFSWYFFAIFTSYSTLTAWRFMVILCRRYFVSSHCSSLFGHKWTYKVLRNIAKMMKWKNFFRRQQSQFTAPCINLGIVDNSGVHIIPLITTTAQLSWQRCWLTWQFCSGCLIHNQENFFNRYAA